MAQWIDIGPADQHPDGTQTCVQAADRSIVLFRLGHTYHAVANICPHAGLPLADGERRGMALTCPYHGYTYHIGTGINLDSPDHEPPVRTFPVQVTHGRIQIDIADPATSTGNP